jgi:formylglycine-generating enzyme required for sulfatase activity
VGSYPPNAFGQYDTHGNVWEWCSDWYARDYYSKGPPKDPPGPSSGSKRVVRGGCWVNNGQHCRAAFRSKYRPSRRNLNLGFRVAAVQLG